MPDLDLLVGLVAEEEDPELLEKSILCLVALAKEFPTLKPGIRFIKQNRDICFPFLHNEIFIHKGNVFPILSLFSSTFFENKNYEYIFCQKNHFGLKI